MASSPIVHDEVASQANSLIGEFADVETSRPLPEARVAVRSSGTATGNLPGPCRLMMQERTRFLTNRALNATSSSQGRFSWRLPCRGLKTG